VTAVDLWELAAQVFEVNPVGRPAWSSIARPAQVPPPMSDPWFVWGIVTGRGWGKTRTGAETVADWARTYPGARIALVAQTFADGRDTMVEGESGLLSVLDPAELRRGSIDTAWNRSLGELFLANGSRFKIYSSEKPRQLRGPQHHFAWGDELASWNDAHAGAAKDTTWSNLLFGVRLPGQRGWPGEFQPRVIVTTTPRPVALLKVPRKTALEEPHRAGLLQRADTVITTGRTVDNLANLSATFKATVVDPLTGTTLGRQELEGEFLEDVEGALISRAVLERARRLIGEVPLLPATVIAVDPAVTTGEDSDETGLIAAGVDHQGDGWVLDDRSGVMPPDEWGRAAWEMVIDHGAAAIVVEDNQGGDMVEHVLATTWQTVAKERQRRGLSTPLPPIVRVHPSRGQGKWIRASALQPMLEQGRIHLVTDPRRPGVLDGLEDQLTSWTGDPGEDSPDRVDAMVHGLSWLLFPMQRSSKQRGQYGDRRRSVTSRR
jgi:phage terminase large subunit-like protein